MDKFPPLMHQPLTTLPKSGTDIQISRTDRQMKNTTVHVGGDYYEQNDSLDKFAQTRRKSQQKFIQKLQDDSNQNKKSHIDERNRISTFSTNYESQQSYYTKEIEDQIVRETNIDNYDQTKTLGFGSYAVVKMALHKLTGVRVAIKSYEKKSLEDPMKFKNVQREIKILTNLKHPNIIKLFQVLESTDQVHLVMEYMPNLPLNEFLKSKSKKRISEEEGKIIIKQLADALSYCHRKWVVHRDIKLENVLIGYDLKVKLIDFGFSVVVPPQHYLNIFCGTPSYMACEIVNRGDYTYQVDTWALMVMLFKICSGHFPFKGLTDAELFKKINLCKPDFPEFFSELLKNLITAVLKQNPLERLTAEQIKQHEWISGGNPSFFENENKTPNQKIRRSQKVILEVENEKN